MCQLRFSESWSHGSLLLSSQQSLLVSQSRNWSIGKAFMMVYLNNFLSRVLMNVFVTRSWSLQVFFHQYLYIKKKKHLICGENVINKQIQMLVPDLSIDMEHFDFQAISISYGNETFQFRKWKETIFSSPPPQVFCLMYQMADIYNLWTTMIASGKLPVLENYMKLTFKHVSVVWKLSGFHCIYPYDDPQPSGIRLD